MPENAKRPATSRAKAANRAWRFWTTPPVLAGGLAFVLYFLCLSPTVTYGGDCGELIAASWRLGIAHPSGYALYCLSGKLFAGLVPLGEVAWRYNLFSAVCGALAIGLLAAIIGGLLQLGKDADGAVGAKTSGPAAWLSAASGALVLAGFYYFWSQCVLAEVYATAALLLTALLYCAVSWRQTADLRWLYSLALIYGLAFNAHLSCVYLAPGLVFYCLWPCRHQLRPRAGRTAVRLGLLFLAGFSIALYLPLRSSTFPTPVGKQWAPLDWTHPATPANFVAHATARQYRVWLIENRPVTIAGRTVSIPQWVQKPEVTRAKLVNFAAMCGLQLGWCLPLAGVGVWASWRRDRTLFALLALTVLLNIGVQIHYTVGDAQNFFFPSYVAMGIWLGLGIAAAARQLGVVPIGAAVGTLLLLQVFVFFGNASNAGVTQAREDALDKAELFERVGAEAGNKPPSVFLGSDDALWGYWYAHFVLGRASGVRTVWGPERTRAMESGTLWKMVAREKMRAPVLLSQFDEGVDRRFPLVPANEKGDLLLATSRELPPPATPIGLSDRRGTAGLVRQARWRTARRDGDVPLVKRSDSAALEVDFNAPPAIFRPILTSRREGATTAGWIQVLMMAASEKSPPAPTLRERRSRDVGGPPLLVWREDRRLVLPLPSAPDGTVDQSTYRAVVAVNMNKEARLTQHNFWVRIVRDRNDTVTPWKNCGVVTLT